jgi:hypothetical protein
MLEARPGYAEEPETTFDAFLEAKDVYERPPFQRGTSMSWPDGAKNDVRAFDREGLALLLAHAPTEIPSPTSGERDAAEPTRGPEGSLLFLRPNTWPLECQRRALESLEDRPAPRSFRDLQRAAYHLLAAVMAGRAEDEILAGAVGALGPRESQRYAVPDASALAELLPLDDVRAQLVAYERAWLEAALTKASGNKSEAARMLGVPRKTFEHRLRSVRGDA